jgi:hypothetical protein
MDRGSARQFSLKVAPWTASGVTILKARRRNVDSFGGKKNA